MLQLKRLSISLLSLLSIPIFLSSAHAGKFDNDNLAIASLDPGVIEAAGYKSTPLQPAVFQNDLQPYVAAELLDPSLVPALKGKLEKSSFSMDSIMVRHPATPVKDDSSPELRHPTSSPVSSHLFDEIGLGSGSLFITGPAAKGQNTLPESSTMLLLGLGLIGLSACAGRKKFKR
jgi:hypothetical protein